MSDAFDSLGDRMKGYEHAARTSLPRRMPAILRVDGKAFHSYTRDCARPFDASLVRAMDVVALTLCDEIQGAQLAYVQSDEISVFIHDYKRLQSSAWFDKQTQKMVSVAASIAAATMTRESVGIFGEIRTCAFDARVFVVSEAEVANYFIWRQQDATRNSVQMLARSMFSHRDCDRKSCSELQEMTFQGGRNWNDLPTAYRRGRCAVRRQYEHEGAMRSRWEIDAEPPIFTADRDYIERLLAREAE